MITKLELAPHETPSEARVLEAVQSAFESRGAGHAEQPTQTVVRLPDGEGDCIFYPGYVRSAGAFGVKVSPYLQARIRRGLGPVTAFTLLVNAETGLPELLVDSMRLTTERTAATTLLGVREIMSDRPPKRIGIVGSGSIGRSHARYAHFCYPQARVAIYSPSLSGTTEVGRHRRQSIDSECPFAVIASDVGDVLDADVVMLCTSSGTPVIDVDATPRHCLISSVGTNIPDTHEIDWRRLVDLDVYCDYRQTCPGTAGDMTLATQAKMWSSNHVLGDIPELLRGSARPSTSRRAYFRATGLALEDIAVARLIAQ